MKGLVIILLKGGLIMSVLFLALVTSTATTEQERTTLATSEREVLGSGYHLTLVTRVSIDLSNPNDFEGCRVGLIETLPRGAFVDPDQTRESERFGGMGGARVNILTKPFVDIEKSAEASVPCDFTVTWSEKSSKASFREALIPMHLRYQQPNQQGHAKVEIPAPIVCSTCALKDFRRSSVATRECAKHFGPNHAHWESSAVELKEFKHVAVPVGYIQDRDQVVYATIGMVTLGTLAIVWSSL
jgi:PIG-X / PBN1